MAVRDLFKISWKTFFNPAGWIDYEGLKSQTRTISDSLKSLFANPQPEREETFAEAMARLEITEAEVKRTAILYRYYALFFCAMGLILMGYAFFLLFSKVAILDWILGLAGSAFLFAQAFRFDFWSLQMRRRQLGLKFEEWKRDVLGIRELPHD